VVEGAEACSGCAPFAGCAEKRSLGLWENRKDRREAFPACPEGPGMTKGVWERGAGKG
jgi:hypothetical protein